MCGCESLLRIVETNDFNKLPHITLKFRPGTDSAIKQVTESSPVHRSKLSKSIHPASGLQIPSAHNKSCAGTLLDETYVFWNQSCLFAHSFFPFGSMRFVLIVQNYLRAFKPVRWPSRTAFVNIKIIIPAAVQYVCQQLVQDLSPIIQAIYECRDSHTTFKLKWNCCFLAPWPLFANPHENTRYALLLVWWSAIYACPL